MCLKLGCLHTERSGTPIDIEKLAAETLRSDSMADVIFIVLTVVFFGVSWLYVIGCDRLKGGL